MTKKKKTKLGERMPLGIALVMNARWRGALVRDLVVCLAVYVIFVTALLIH